MDYDALIRSPLRCWGHEDCREHPELGMLCGEHPAEMCVSDEQRLALPRATGASGGGDGDGNGDPTYTNCTDGDGGVDSGGVIGDGDYDCRTTHATASDRWGGGFGYRDGDGWGSGDRRGRTFLTDFLSEDAENVHAALRQFERGVAREGGR